MGVERGGCRSQDGGQEQSGEAIKGLGLSLLRVMGNHEDCVGSNAMDRFTFGADPSSCGLDDKQ